MKPSIIWPWISGIRISIQFFTLGGIYVWYFDSSKKKRKNLYHYHHLDKLQNKYLETSYKIVFTIFRMVISESELKKFVMNIQHKLKQTYNV